MLEQSQTVYAHVFNNFPCKKIRIYKLAIEYKSFIVLTLLLWWQEISHKQSPMVLLWKNHGITRPNQE